MWRLPASRHQYATQNNSNKTATKQPQINHKDRTFFETVQEPDFALETRKHENCKFLKNFVSTSWKSMFKLGNL